jgi:hypothetical protein
MVKWMLVAAALATGSALYAQGTPDRAAVIAQDPRYVLRHLRLEAIPEPAGASFSLFNGRDLDEWDTWLGYADPSLTYRENPAVPLGAGQGRGTMFRVVEEDGAPALFVSGETWGSIVHRRDIANYHLRLEYKWSGRRHAPRLELPENNGLLYHSNGAPGSVFGTWMPAVEFEIMTGSTGMVVPVGTQIGVRTRVGQDRRLAEYPHRRYMAGGREISVEQPAWNVEKLRDAEYPVGIWNQLDLYVVGDRAIHVVNGVPVMEVHGLTVTDPTTGRRRPLTSGRIQFQSEGAETFFRDIVVTPITRLPRLVYADTGEAVSD